MSADPCGYNSHLIHGSVFSRWWAGRNRRVSAGLPSCSGVDMVRKKGLSERRRRVVEAVKRLREIVAEAWNASEPEYVPPPGLNPGLGVAQIVPRSVREGDLLPALAKQPVHTAADVAAAQKSDGNLLHALPPRVAQPSFFS